MMPIQLDEPPVSFCPNPSIAQSPDARVVDELVAEVDRKATQSKYLWGWRIDLCEKMEAAIQEAYQETEPGDPLIRSINLSRIKAYRFIQMMPIASLMPEISIEPDGEIAFDWINGKHGYLSVSVGGGDSLSYAAIIGTDRHHGKVLAANVFPQTIYQFIRLVQAQA